MLLALPFAVLDCVVERDEELGPPLDSRIVGPHFANALRCLAVGEYAGIRSPKVSSEEAFESPNAATGPPDQEESKASPS